MYKIACLKHPVIWLEMEGEEELLPACDEEILKEGRRGFLFLSSWPRTNTGWFFGCSPFSAVGCSTETDLLLLVCLLTYLHAA